MHDKKNSRIARFIQRVSKCQGLFISWKNSASYAIPSLKGNKDIVSLILNQSLTAGPGAEISLYNSLWIRVSNA